MSLSDVCPRVLELGERCRRHRAERWRSARRRPRRRGAPLDARARTAAASPLGLGHRMFASVSRNASRSAFAASPVVFHRVRGAVPQDGANTSGNTRRAAERRRPAPATLKPSKTAELPRAWPRPMRGRRLRSEQAVLHALRLPVGRADDRSARCARARGARVKFAVFRGGIRGGVRFRTRRGSHAWRAAGEWSVRRAEQPPPPHRRGAAAAIARGAASTASPSTRAVGGAASRTRRSPSARARLRGGRARARRTRPSPVVSMCARRGLAHARRRGARSRRATELACCTRRNSTSPTAARVVARRLVDSRRCKPRGERALTACRPTRTSGLDGMSASTRQPLAPPAHALAVSTSGRRAELGASRVAHRGDGGPRDRRATAGTGGVLRARSPAASVLSQAFTWDGAALWKSGGPPGNPARPRPRGSRLDRGPPRAPCCLAEGAPEEAVATAAAATSTSTADGRPSVAAATGTRRRRRSKTGTAEGEGSP